jgi:WhiB family redox-sensing transcriptional regulator
MLTLNDLMWQTETDWRESAACNGIDSDVFFPASDDESASAKAKEICAVCPVRETCLSYSLSTNQRAGGWGGLDANERRRMRRRIRDRERRKAS